MAAENFKVKKGLEVGTGSTITSGGINVTGVITATQLVGDGSGLTNVVGSGSGIVVKDEGSAVGTAGTINFVGSGVVASLAAGQATVTISSGGLNDVVDDTTPQLGGGLDLNSKFISGSGGINVTGVVTATTFVGNGDFVNLDVSGITTSALLDVGNLTNGRVPYVGSASGRLVDSANLTFDGSSLFVSGINVVSGGTTSTFGADIVTRNFKATGISTFNSHLSIGGALTASSGTFTNNVSVGGNMTATLFDISPGSGNDAIILVSSGGGQNNDFSRIRQVVSDDSFRIENKASGSYESLFQGTGNAGVKLYFAGTQKLETTGTGIASPNISVSGVGTFSTRIDTNGVSFGTNSTTFAAKFADDAVANFGTNNSLQIHHDGTDASIKHVNNSGSLRLQDDTFIVLEKIDGTNLLRCDGSGAVNLYFNGGSPKLVTDTGGVKITGVCTATTFSGAFSGDGSGLTGVTASGTGIIIQHDGSNVGTAGTINFSTNLDVTPISAGIVTVTASGSGGGVSLANGVDNRVVTATGAAALNGETNLTWDGTTLAVVSQQTVSGSVVVGSAVTTNSTGIEARSGIITAAHYHALTGSFRMQIGSSNQGFYMYNGNSTFGSWHWSSSASRFQFSGSGTHALHMDDFSSILIAPKTGNVRLQYAESTKLATTNHGIDITGVCTATSFSGDVPATNLTGTIANGRFPTTLPAVSGANLTNLPVPTQITVTNEASDQTCNILFTTAATGDLAPKSSSTLTYDANGEVLSATLFSGSGASLTNLNASNIGSGTMSASRLTGALPAISGASLTNISADTVDIGTANANQNYYPVFTETSGSSKTVNIDGGNNLTYNPGTNTLTAGTFSGSGASLTNLPASTPTTSDIQVVYEITNQSSFSYFRFAGNGVDSSANNPDIYLTRGQKYRFINNSGGSHPFQIQTTASSPYTTGVTYPSGTSASSGNIDFAVRWDAPSQLKYVCTSHGSMVGNIYIDGGDSGRRTTAAAATGSIANAAAANISITAAKTYSLLKVQTSAAAWVTLYTDSTSRSNDASRGETTDPTPGSGVIAEVITSGAATQILSPGVIGWNNDSTPSSTVYAKVVNKSGSTQAITVTLHYLQMEI